MSSNRRQFLRYSLTVLGTVAAGGTAQRLCASGKQAPGPCLGDGMADMPGMGPVLTADHHVVNAKPHAGDEISAARIGVPGRRWIMVIDLTKCDGCGTCIAACSKMHFVPPDRQWIKVLQMPLQEPEIAQQHQASEKEKPHFFPFPQPCYHCDNPPCTKVCPVDATFKRSDGVVLIDNERCIGCRFCMAACPYGARSFNWGKPQDPPQATAKEYSPEYGFPRRIGTVEKCDFCPDMAQMGMLPACVAACPMGAMYYGDENEDAVSNPQGETLRLSQLLIERDGYQHMAELGTKPRVYYLPHKTRMYAQPSQPTKE